MLFFLSYGLAAASWAVIDSLSEIQDGSIAPGDFLDDWEDEPGRDQLNLLEDVSLNYKQLLKLVLTLGPKP